MKRYNIHLDPEWMKALDEIHQAIIDDKKDNWRWSSLTRSDLIRVAISKYFKLEEGYSHVYGINDLEKVIKKVLKRARAKGV